MSGFTPNTIGSQIGIEGENSLWRHPLARGDHFFVWRQHRGIPFQHHGIDVGDGTVIHFTDGSQGVAGPGGSTEHFEIRQTTIDVVTRSGRDQLHVIDHPGKLAADRIVERAISQVGRRGYDLVYDNCEHFACWCAVDRKESGQVIAVCRRVGAAGIKAIASGTVRAISKHGAKRITRGASPWLMMADAAQWATEACGHHVGLKDPVKRRQAGMAVGSLAALGIGSVSGPVGIAVAGGIWVAGELAGEASRCTYERVRVRKIN